jgi:hypothetical protein
VILIKDDAGSLVKESSEEEIIAFMLSICMTDHAMILYFEAMNTLSLDFDDKIYRCDSSVSVSYS